MSLPSALADGTICEDMTALAKSEIRLKPVWWPLIRWLKPTAMNYKLSTSILITLPGLPVNIRYH